MREGTEQIGTDRVLLVEDAPLNQKLGKAMLEHCGCRVDVAQTGSDALRLLARNRYGIIFMDCQLPGLDGYATTGCIRQSETGGEGNGAVGRTPIIALTACAMEGDREKCLRAGMDDYLSKPFGMTGLQSVLDRWLPPRCPAFAEGKGIAGGDAPGEAPAVNAGGGEGAPAVERAVLDRIAALQPPGSNAALRKIISLYFDQAERLKHELRAAVTAGDPAALERAAHILKSSSAGLGAAPLAAMFRELETMGRKGALAGAGEILAVLEREYERVRAFLEGYRDTLA
jgi:CheY-like chemotaxis protein/HPt (histidine-containing phosphotransfer) domain-containing protein